MPKAKQDDTDPVVVAALIDDPNDDEEEKKAQKESLNRAEEASKEELGEDADEQTDEGQEEKPPAKPAKDEKPDEGQKPKPKESESDDDESKEKPPAKPEVKPEKDDSLTDAEQQEQDRQTRKEKREQRRKEWLASFGQPKARTPSARERLLTPDPTYKPLDYDAQDEFKTAELAQDRTKYGENMLARGAAIERHYAQQERYWDKVEMEAEMLTLDPKYQFLNEKNKEEFDEDRAEVINGLFLNLIGYRETPVLDQSGRQAVDATGQPLYQSSVQRTDISFRDFVKGYVEHMEEWADEQESHTADNLAKQRSSQGLRPGGSVKRSKTSFRPGSFKSMSDEEFDATDEESDDFILSAFE